MSITNDYNNTLSAPPGTSNAAPGFFGKIKSGVGNYFSNIKNDVVSNYNEAAQAEKASASGQENPFQAGATIAKNVSGAVLSPIGELPGFKQAGQGFNDVGQAFVNSSVGNKLTDSLAQHVSPNVLGAASDTLQGGLNVAGIAGTIEMGGNMWDKIYNKPVDTLSNRVADATPTYDKNMVGQQVKNPAGEIVPRVNEGEGLTGARTVNTSAAESEAGAELNNLKDYPSNGTALQKSHAISQGLSAEAEGMRGGLQAEDQASPLDSAAEKAKVSNLVKSNLPKEIQEKLGYLGPEDENSMSPNAKIYREAQISQAEETLPKTAAGRYYQRVLDAMKEYDGTREGKLDLRQKIDSVYKSARGKLAFGSDSQNALDEVNSDIRNALNKDLAETSKNTDTQSSLKRQTNLYRAKDVLDAKASAEAPSQIGRFFQNHPILHRLATRDALRVLSSATGAGIATSFITKLLQGKE